ncbi:PREDICTED: paramyosin, short form-like [Nicrophorus vespilloides]|uniref:Paramyosin, short form-like n=1 Tax=Nicrophorus vespilloides TaxID=110193 RepID=A0ABM1M3F6_NICVS|nr:PREDICTED: paramyosin, short form-like [Nicrophorus vespilloides]
MSRPTSSRYDWVTHPATKAYDYNYGYGVNFYQPMIDYIDAKDSGRRTRYPHLPWTDERALDAFSPRKLVRSYTEDDLSKIARRTETRAKDFLQDFNARTQSSFLLHKSASAANITTQVKSTEVRKKKETVRKIKVLKSKMADEIVNFDPDFDRKITESLKSAQKFLRGKSAKGIEAQLLSESKKHIAEGVDIDQTNKYLKNVVHSTHDYQAHARLMCKRMEKEVDASFMQPLDNLSADLKTFDKKTSTYFSEKRCRPDPEIAHTTETTCIIDI